MFFKFERTFSRPTGRAAEPQPHSILKVDFPQGFPARGAPSGQYIAPANRKRAKRAVHGAHYRQAPPYGHDMEFAARMAAPGHLDEV